MSRKSPKWVCLFACSLSTIAVLFGDGTWVDFANCALALYNGWLAICWAFIWENEEDDEETT